jgi:hypothetical protein
VDTGKRALRARLRGADRGERNETTRMAPRHTVMTDLERLGEAAPLWARAYFSSRRRRRSLTAARISPRPIVSEIARDNIGSCRSAFERKPMATTAAGTDPTMAGRWSIAGQRRLLRRDGAPSPVYEIRSNPLRSDAPLQACGYGDLQFPEQQTTF